MESESNSTFVVRQVLSALLGILIVGIGAWACHHMIISWGISGVMGASLMPLLVGLFVGLAIRYTCVEGNFTLASFGLALIFIFGLTCSAMRHKMLFDSRLQSDVATTYEQTLAYAKIVVPAEADDE